MTKLKERKCKPCNGEVPPMAKDEAIEMLQQIDGWTLSDDGKMISKDFKFKGFYKTMSFVNSVAWIANAQVHHPDLEVGYAQIKTFILNDTSSIQTLLRLKPYRMYAVFLLGMLIIPSLLPAALNSFQGKSLFAEININTDISLVFASLILIRRCSPKATNKN